MTGIKTELLDRTLKILLVQGNLVVFGQNFCYMRRGLLIQPKKCREPLYAVLEVLVIFIRKGAIVKNSHWPRHRNGLQKYQ